MQTFRICATISLALWVGALSLFAGVVTPVIFKTLKREEAGRLLGALFPAVDRWCLVWGAVTVGNLLAIFFNRHFEARSLVLEIPIAVMFWLTLHVNYVLHPQIRDLKRKIELPEFQGTAHQQAMQFSFQRLHRRSVRLHGIVLTLGLLCMGLLPGFLK